MIKVWKMEILEILILCIRWMMWGWKISVIMTTWALVDKKPENQPKARKVAAKEDRPVTDNKNSHGSSRVVQTLSASERKKKGGRKPGAVEWTETEKNALLVCVKSHFHLLALKQVSKKSFI
jgi:hypothetical protein